MYETLEAISQVAIGVAGFSGVVVVLQHRDDVVDFRLRSLLSLAAEVIVFSFLPPLLGLVTSAGWTIAALIYSVFHLLHIGWSYISYRRVGELVSNQIPLDNVLMTLGAMVSVAVFIAALLAPPDLTQFAYTTLLLWALGIAGVQFMRILLQNRGRGT